MKGFLKSVLRSWLFPEVAEDYEISRLTLAEADRLNDAVFSLSGGSAKNLRGEYSARASFFLLPDTQDQVLRLIGAGGGNCGQSEFYRACVHLGLAVFGERPAIIHEYARPAATSPQKHRY